MLPRSLRAEVSVSDVNSVVNTEANSKDYVDSREDVNGDAPEVDEANNIH